MFQKVPNFNKLLETEQLPNLKSAYDSLDTALNIGKEECVLGVPHLMSDVSLAHLAL